MYSLQEELFTSLLTSEAPLHERNAIFIQSRQKIVRGCEVNKPPIHDTLKDNGWDEVESISDDDTITSMMEKDENRLEVVKTPLSVGDYIVLNTGDIYILKSYDSCTFAKKINDGTITTDIRRMTMLMNHDLVVKVVIILTPSNNSHGIDMNLLASIRTRMIMSNINLLRSESDEETASLICSFSDVVDLTTR